MTIGDAAQRLAVNPQTIRYYERKGLLPSISRSSAGYRELDEDDVRRIRFIRHAQDVGFTLGEIGELLALRAEPDSSCDDVLGYAGAKISELERRIVRLRSMKRVLETLSARCASGRAASECPVLDAFEENHSINGPKP